MASAHYHNCWPLAQLALFIDKIYQTLRIIRQQYCNNRTHYKPYCYQNYYYTYDNHSAAHQGSKHIIVGACPQVYCTENSFLEMVNKFIVENNSHTKAYKHNTSSK